MSRLPQSVPTLREIEIFENLLSDVEWESLEKRQTLVYRLHELIHRWDSPYPDLRQFLQPRQIDQLLEEAVNIDGDYDDDYPGELIVKFVVSCGYKDVPEFDGDGKLLSRSTPLHTISYNYAGAISPMVMSDLFLIYDRFDVNYVNEIVSHFHVACLYGCLDVVEKFLASGQNPNCPGFAPPLYFALIGRPETSSAVMRILLAHGADPNFADKEMRNTILHQLSTRHDPRDYDLMKRFIEVCEETKQTLQVDAQNEDGSTPFLVAMAFKNYEVAELLLRNGANPNYTNKAESTLLHFYCMTDEHEESMKKLFEICDNSQRTLEIDHAGNAWNLTPLHVAVMNFLPYNVNLLLERGADLSNFVFPDFEGVSKRFAAIQSKNLINYNLEAASKLMLVVEHLKRKGYELAESDALAIMRFFVKFDFFKGSEKIEEHACRRGFVEDAERSMINSNVSLYKLIELGPRQAAKQVTYADYLAFSRSKAHKDLPKRRTSDAFLCDKLAWKFLMSWALEPFIGLTHYRLPMECCEMILENLGSKDLINIYLAVSGQESG